MVGEVGDREGTGDVGTGGRVGGFVGLEGIDGVCAFSGAGITRATGSFAGLGADPLVATVAALGKGVLPLVGGAEAGPGTRVPIVLGEVVLATDSGIGFDGESAREDGVK